MGNWGALGGVAWQGSLGAWYRLMLWLTEVWDADGTLPSINRPRKEFWQLRSDASALRTYLVVSIDCGVRLTGFGIEIRLRGDPYTSYMAVSTNWGSMWVP